MIKDSVTLNIPIEIYNRLVYLGIIPSNNSTEENIRSYNVGESNYSNNKHIIQPWTIWLDYPELTSFDHDIIKRVLRTKKGESRETEYNKIIDICKERLRQLHCESEFNQYIETPCD